MSASVHQQQARHDAAACNTMPVAVAEIVRRHTESRDWYERQARIACAQALTARAVAWLPVYQVESCCAVAEQAAADGSSTTAALTAALRHARAAGWMQEPV